MITPIVAAATRFSVKLRDETDPRPYFSARRLALSEQVIRVRQVTDVHSNWGYQGDLENGKFSYQLILDNGAEEALIMPTTDDAKVLGTSSTTPTPSTGTWIRRSSSSAR